MKLILSHTEMSFDAAAASVCSHVSAFDSKNTTIKRFRIIHEQCVSIMSEYWTNYENNSTNNKNNENKVDKQHYIKKFRFESHRKVMTYFYRKSELTDGNVN